VLELAILLWAEKIVEAGKSQKELVISPIILNLSKLE
jgi:hypothetical protein